MNSDENKSITLSDFSIQVSDLKEALEKLDSNDELCVKLVSGHRKKDDEVVAGLKILCNKLYQALCYANRCVEVCAENEKKTGELSIYYFHRNQNVGATGLLAYINALLDNYYHKLIQIDLAR